MFAAAGLCSPSPPLIHSLTSSSPPDQARVGIGIGIAHDATGASSDCPVTFSPNDPQA